MIKMAILMLSFAEDEMPVGDRLKDFFAKPHTKFH
jgi:hypothetical protein